MVAIARCQVQDEVLGAAEEEHLGHLGEGLHLVHELAQLGRAKKLFYRRRNGLGVDQFLRRKAFAFCNGQALTYCSLYDNGATDPAQVKAARESFDKRRTGQEYRSRLPADMKPVKKTITAPASAPVLLPVHPANAHVLPALVQMLRLKAYSNSTITIYTGEVRRFLVLLIGEAGMSGSSTNPNRPDGFIGN